MSTSSHHGSKQRLKFGKWREEANSSRLDFCEVLVHNCVRSRIVGQGFD